MTHVSPDGRAVLAAAVSDDRNWSLAASAEDALIESLDALSDSDLEAAVLLARHLTEAIACVHLRRDMTAGA